MFGLPQVQQIHLRWVSSSLHGRCCSCLPETSLSQMRMWHRRTCGLSLLRRCWTASTSPRFLIWRRYDFCWACCLKISCFSCMASGINLHLLGNSELFLIIKNKIKRFFFFFIRVVLQNCFSDVFYFVYECWHVNMREKGKLKQVCFSFLPKSMMKPFLLHFTFYLLKHFDSTHDILRERPIHHCRVMAWLFAEKLNDLLHSLADFWIFCSQKLFFRKTRQKN